MPLSLHGVGFPGATTRDDPAQRNWSTVFSNRNHIAAFAFLVWDILITMDQEIELVWRAPWQKTNLVYFFIRYFPVLSEIPLLFDGTELTQELHLTRRYCLALEVYQSVATMMTIAMLDFILITRVRAMYSNNRFVRNGLPVLYAVDVVAMIVFVSLGISEDPMNVICAPRRIPTIIVIYGAVAASLQLLLFILTLIKFIPTVRHRRREVTLAHLLMRDGAWAFGIIIAVEQLQAYMILIDDGDKATGMFFLWIISIFSFCGYRLLLNLRAFALADQRAAAMRDTSISINFHISTVPQFTLSERSTPFDY